MDEPFIGFRREHGAARSGTRLDLRQRQGRKMAATPATTSTTQALKSHLAQVFAQYPIEVAHGDGVWLHARDGRKILDFYGGHAVAGVGFAPPLAVARPGCPVLCTG